MHKKLEKVKGFENCVGYIIYDDGRLYSPHKKTFLKPHKDTKGYFYYNLRSKKAKYSCPKIHRLVMLAFSKDKPKEQINHIDGDKSNNNINNLEWCTNRENRIHGQKNGLRKEVGYGIAQYDLDGNFIRAYDTCKEAMEHLGIKGICYGNIGRVINGKRKTAYGFLWKQYKGSTTIPKGSTLK